MDDALDTTTLLVFMYETLTFPRAGVQVDGWGLGLGETWDLDFDTDQCNQNPSGCTGRHPLNNIVVLEVHIHGLPNSVCI